MVGDDLGVEQVQWQLVGVDRGQVEQRVAEGLGGELGDILRGELARSHELLHEAHARLRGLLLDGRGVGWLQAALLHQSTTEGAEGSRGGGHKKD